MATRTKKQAVPEAQRPLIPQARPEWAPVQVHVDQLPASAEILGEPDPDFTESIRKFGIVQPVALLYRGNGSGPVSTDGPDKWAIIEGGRRIKAARLVGLEYVPANYTPDLGMFNMQALRLAANDLRSENLATDIEALEDMMRRGATEDEISAATGVKLATVRAKVAILQGLHTYHRGLLKAGAISQNVAEGLSKLSAASQERIARDHKTAAGAINVTHDTVKAARTAERQAATAAAPQMAIDVPATWESTGADLIAQFVGLVPLEYEHRDQLLALCEELAQVIEPLDSLGG